MATTKRRRIPKRVFLSGDKNIGKTLVGHADSRLRLLERDMEFQKLKVGAKHYRLDGGGFIHLKSCHALQEIHIYIPPVGVEPEDEEQIIQSCMCTCCFAVGRIAGPPLEIEEQIFNGARTTYLRRFYDVEICRKDGKNEYILNVEASDHAIYQTDEVMVLAVEFNFQYINVDTPLNQNLSNHCLFTGLCGGVCSPGECSGTSYRILPISLATPLTHKWILNDMWGELKK